MYNKFKYCKKLFRMESGLQLLTDAQFPFSKAGIRAVYFHRVGNFCCDKLRLKINIRIERIHLNKP